MQYNSQNIKDRLFLFTPGPVNVAENVRSAICKTDICHREEDFEFLLLSIEEKLLKLFEIKETDNFRAVVITGSGTAANESILSSVVGNKNILILSNGEFGERLYNISKIHNQNTSILKFAWGEQLDLETIDAYLKNNDVDIISMVHHETSSGMLNPIEQVGQLSIVHNKMFIVDCVSSAGAEPIDIEKCNISFCSSSSSKAIGSYPGVSFVIGAKREFEKLKDMPIKTTYLNLYKFYHFITVYSQTPNTPAVPLLFAFERALLNILEEGVGNRHKHINMLANLLREGMERLGLKFLINREDMCSVLTTIHIPSHVDLDVFKSKLRDKRIIIYDGKGPFSNKVFQVGNIGTLTPDDIDYFLNSLKEVLQTFEKFPFIENILENNKEMETVY